MRQIYECGICGAYHDATWDGDCREDAARIMEPLPTDEIVTLCFECGTIDGHDRWCGETDPHPTS